MRNGRWLVLAACVLGAAAIALPLGLVSEGEAKSQATVRQIYLSAVEWKGSASVDKEPYPGPVPAGGGYESFPPGHEEVGGDTNKWAIETYRFDSAVAVAYAGERVVLNIFGVNAKVHEIVVPALDVQFAVKRGVVAKVSLGKIAKPGLYSIICVTHPPAHRMDLLVLPKSSAA